MQKRNPGGSNFGDQLLQKFVSLMYMYIYEGKSLVCTKPHFNVIFFVFLNAYFGNLEVRQAKNKTIFGKYMSATCSRCLHIDHFFTGCLLYCPFFIPLKTKKISHDMSIHSYFLVLIRNHRWRCRIFHILFLVLKAFIGILETLGILGRNI